jgi:hypothetical protein
MSCEDCNDPENATIERACQEARGAVRALLAAARTSTEFRGPEHGAVHLLREATQDFMDSEPTAATCGIFLAATKEAHRRLGAPGDFGYGTPEGDAMQWLYASTRLLAGAMRKTAVGDGCEKPAPRAE